MPKVAQFISAGEDSRAIAGLLPKHVQRDAFIFLDQMNREGNIAQKISKIYKANFNLGLREKTYYIDILSESTALTGSGNQYCHAHSLGFVNQFNLADYPAVFGGFMSDTLLKGHHIPLIRGSKLFFPIVAKKNTPVGLRFQKMLNYIDTSILEKVQARQIERLNQIKSLQPNNTSEWFHFYPATMHNDFQYFHSNRRLFKSYEPFMSHEAVKVAARVPISWKLNRRLFNHAMKPFLQPSKFVFHADGRLPYFNFFVNLPIHITIWFYRQFRSRILKINDGNQGPWGEWQHVFNSSEWKAKVAEYSKNINNITCLKSEMDIITLMESGNLSRSQVINFMQILHESYTIWNKP